MSLVCVRFGSAVVSSKVYSGESRETLAALAFAGFRYLAEPG